MSGEAKIRRDGRQDAGCIHFMSFCAAKTHKPKNGMDAIVGKAKIRRGADFRPRTGLARNSPAPEGPGNWSG
jgi:hypothetical protein